MPHVIGCPLLQLHRFRFAIARLPETRTRSLSCLSLCSHQPECGVNPCVKIRLPKPDPRRLQWHPQEPRQGHCQAKTELKQKIMDFYNRSVTARRGHKKRLAQAGYSELEGHPRLGPGSAERHARSSALASPGGIGVSRSSAATVPPSRSSRARMTPWRGSWIWHSVTGHECSSDNFSYKQGSRDGHLHPGHRQLRR